MASAYALAIFSGKIIYNFGFQESLRTFLKPIFTGGVVAANCICSAAFCESAALRATPSVIACGDATFPKGTASAVAENFAAIHKGAPLGELPNEVRLKGFFLSLPTKNSPGGLPEEHSFFYSKHGCAALTWCAAGLTSGTLPRRGQRCRPECRTPEIQLRPARQPATLRT